MSRLAAAQEEYTQPGWGLLVPLEPWQCGGSGKLYKYIPMVSQICLREHSFGDTVIHFWEESLEQRAIGDIAHYNQHRRAQEPQEAEWMEIKQIKKTSECYTDQNMLF